MSALSTASKAKVLASLRAVAQTRLAHMLYSFMCDALGELDAQAASPGALRELFVDFQSHDHSRALLPLYQLLLPSAQEAPEVMWYCVAGAVDEAFDTVTSLLKSGEIDSREAVWVRRQDAAVFTGEATKKVKDLWEAASAVDQAAWAALKQRVASLAAPKGVAKRVAKPRQRSATRRRGRG